MNRATLLLILALTLTSVAAFGQEIYRWVDEKGTIHFADDFTLVPERYRDQIQKRTLSEKPSSSPAIPPRRTEPTGPIDSTPERKDMFGRGEEWWRAKMKEWNDKLQNAQKNYDLTYSNLREKEKELVDAKFKPDSLKRKLKSEIKELEEKAKDREKDLNDARNMLEKVLPKQAADDGADPVWLKPKE